MATTNTFAPQFSLASFSRPRHSLPKGSKVIVVGAGSFGGWTALHFLRAGMKVTIVDPWGAGNSRSSSGDETRVIRSTYGANEFYFDLNVRALELWKDFEKTTSRKVFHNTGVLWLCYQDKTPMVDDSIPYAIKHKMEYQYLTRDELAAKYPVVNISDIHHGWFDPFGGYLKARESTQLVMERFLTEGGHFVQSLARPMSIGDHGFVATESGEKLEADLIIYACGSWLGKLFPQEIGNRIICSRQEAYYFGVPSAKAKSFDDFPVWVDVDGSDYYYGIPGNASRGFKIGVDRRGPEFDPTTGDHIADREVLAHARKFIEHRFPDLKAAPLVENRVCPYENSPDGNFIFEQHPSHHNVWFLGGGSGHGFKHGPALGELVVKTLTN